MKRTSQKLAKIKGRAARDSMHDFINAVHSRPQLWQRRYPEYHNREKRDAAWQEVAKRLHPKFDALPNAERKKIVVLLTKRWKNTRDSFFRAQRRKEKEGEETRSYIYQDEMSFLLRDDDNNELALPKEADQTEDELKPFDKSGESSSSYGAGDAGVHWSDGREAKTEELAVPTKGKKSGRKRRPTQKALAAKIKHRRMAMDTPLPDVGIHSSEHMEQPASPAGNGEDQESAAGEANLKEHLNQNSGAAEAFQSATDPDQSFFDTIKPIVRDMSIDRKLDFQIEVLRLLKEFRDGH